MADKDEKLVEKPEGETEELIPVEDAPEVKPEDDKPAAEDEKPAEDAVAGDEDDSDEDERLGQHEDDDKDSPAKRNRQRRNQARKRHLAALEARMAQIAEQNEILAKELLALKSGQTSTTLSSLEDRIAKAEGEAEQALRIHAEAIKAGNGDDAAVALRIREEAREEARQLKQQRDELKTSLESKPEAPTVDPQLLNHAKNWMAENSGWYDPNGGNEASRIAKQVDSEVAADGFDPRTKLYWDELTSRLRDVFQAAAKQQQQPEKTGRKGPPTGAQREGNGSALKANEVYVEPEFKAALIEAGIWDDPVRRNNALKERKALLERQAR